MKNLEYVILVDKNDKELGTMEKMEAHRKASLHRAISVFILNNNNEWLLQRRAFHKYHSNGLWSNTCCSHPQPGEKSIDAANRRLEQEMGIKTDLKKVFHFIYKEPLDNNLTEYELDHVFVGYTDEIPKINQEEVSQFKYMTYPELNKDIKKNPDNYTVWFKRIVDRVENQINKQQ